MIPPPVSPPKADQHVNPYRGRPFGPKTGGGTPQHPAVLLIRQARALVFDFDGTLVDSNPIKWRAFERIFANASDHREEILAYCHGNPHLLRGEKFKYVYEQILGMPYTPDIAAKLHRQFEAATTRQISEAPEILGASRFLRWISQRSVTALLSGTPHEALVEILSARGWQDWFSVIQGAPVDKPAWLRGFQTARRLQESEVVVFGDTEEDAQAASAAGCAFIAVGQGRVSGCGRVSIRDFMELLNAADVHD